MKSADIYQSISNQILEALRKTKASGGLAPWHRPWSVNDPMPSNPYSGVTYQGSNIITLWLSQIGHGWKTAKFLTFKQVGLYNSQHNCQLRIRKGEHGTPIIRWVRALNTKHYIPRPDGRYTDRQTGMVVGKERAEYVTLRSYFVFNLDQMDDVPSELLNPPQLYNWSQTRDNAWSFIKAGPWTLVDGGDSAHYKPSADLINIPEPERFQSEDDRLATVFHELTHWTGHHSRLKRFNETNNVPPRSSTAYAKEELVAELGAAFLSAHFGLNPEHLQHASYIDWYMALLKHDERAFVHASSQAMKATDYILLGGHDAKLPEDNHNDEQEGESK